MTLEDIFSFYTHPFDVLSSDLLLVESEVNREVS